MTAFAASLRYEFRMQVRKRSVWIVPALTLVLFVLIGGSLLRDLFDPDEVPPEARTAVTALAVQIYALLTIGFGCLLADRLIRDDRLRVAPILDATPARGTARLLGKYLGAAAATAMPRRGPGLVGGHRRSGAGRRYGRVRASARAGHAIPGRRADRPRPAGPAAGAGPRGRLPGGDGTMSALGRRLGPAIRGTPPRSRPTERRTVSRRPPSW